MISDSPPSPNSGKPDRLPESDQTGTDSVETQFGQLSVSPSEPKDRMQQKALEPGAGTDVSARSVKLSGEMYPQFSEISDKELVDSFCRMVPDSRHLDVSRLNVQKNNELRQAKELFAEYEQKAAKNKPGAKRSLHHSIEHYLSCAETCQLLAQHKGQETGLALAKLVLEKALKADSQYARGLMLFFISESLLAAQPSTVERNVRICDCLRLAIAAGVAPASWRMGCFYTGFTPFTLPQDFPLGLQHLQDASEKPMCEYQNSYRDPMMQSYYNAPDESSYARQADSVVHDQMMVLTIIRELYEGIAKGGRKSVGVEAVTNCDLVADSRLELFTRGLVMLERGSHLAAYKQFIDVAKLLEQSALAERQTRYLRAHSYFMAGYALQLSGDKTKQKEALGAMEVSAQLGLGAAYTYCAEWCFRNRNLPRAYDYYMHLAKLTKYRNPDAHENVQHYVKLALSCLPEPEDEPEDKPPSASQKVLFSPEKAAVEKTSVAEEKTEVEETPGAVAATRSESAIEVTRASETRGIDTEEQQEAQEGGRAEPFIKVKTRRKHKAHTSKAKDKNEPVQESVESRLWRIKALIKDESFEEAKTLLDSSLKDYSGRDSHAPICEEYVWFYLNCWESSPWINSLARSEKISVRKALNKTLSQALPWAARMVSHQLGIEFKSGDSWSKLVDACYSQLSVMGRTPELESRLQRMASTIGHLKSSLAASGGVSTSGQSGNYQAFYQMADRICRSRIKRKIQARLNISSKLQVISAEEAELLRAALKS